MAGKQPELFLWPKDLLKPDLQINLIVNEQVVDGHADEEDNDADVNNKLVSGETGKGWKAKQAGGFEVQWLGRKDGEGGAAGL